MNTDLVLEGGGVKGVALAGAVRAFTAAGFAPYRVAGTSAGAIVGSLIAAGMPPERLAQVIEGIDWLALLDTSPLDRVPLGKALSLVFEKGVYEGDTLHALVDDLLAEQGVETFADLRLDDAGAEAGDRGAWRFVCVVADVSRGQLVRLPWDYHEYGLDPDRQRVADAVRASASVPFLYEPVVLRHRVSGDDSVLVDGAVLSNFPVGIFDRADGRPPRHPTFGVKLSSRVDALRGRRVIEGPVGLLVATVDAMLHACDAMHLDNPAKLARTVFVDTSDVGVLDFDLSPEKARELYARGLAAGRAFLAQRVEEPSGP